jgi:hypothetical protein
MNQQKVTSKICGSREACAPVLEQVLSFWSSDLTNDLPEEVHEHLLGCCSCIRVWIALEAALELASCDGSSSNLAG